MKLKRHPALIALLGLLTILSAGARAESPQVKLTSRALAAQYAGLASPTIAIASPAAGQPYAVGEKATVSWHYTGISKKKKFSVLLQMADGKTIRKLRIRADRFYSFIVSPKLATKLSRISVCIPRSAKFRKICDSRDVTVLGSQPTNPNQNAQLKFNPESTGFVTLKDVEPPSQVLEISISGSQAAQFSIASSASWLSVSPGNGTAPGSVNLTAQVAGLAAGTYKTTLKATVTGGTATTDIPVSLEILKPSAKTPLSLEFSATSLGFDITAGALSESRQISLLTSNGAAAPFQVSSNANWLTVSASAGSTPAGLTIAANADGLAPGSYNGEVAASAEGFESAKLGVTLTVTAPVTPALQFSTSGLDFTSASGTSPTVQSTQVSINTEATAAFTLDEQAPWLTVLPSGTSTPAAITLAVNGAGLPPGNYSTTLTAQAAGYPAAAIPVRFSVTAPGAGTLFSDDFADGNSSGWNVVNEVASANPNWQESGGQFRLTNLVGLATDAVRQGHNIGSFAVRGELLGLQDYQFDVTTTPFSEFDVDIGVMFRYVDQNNYYRLSLGNGLARLEKRAGGAFSTLAGNARGYVRGVPQAISVSVQGNLIQISVNGERLFSVRDGSFATGGIALYCRDACAFDDVRIRPVPAAPSIAVSKPEAHTLVTQTRFDVSAVVLNHPGVSATVEFSLSGIPGACEQAAESGPGLFTARCSIPGDGTVSDVVASLRNAGGIVDMDSSERVAYGNQIIAIGDSITYGLEDDNPQDNQEPGGWVISGGYSSVLTKLLNQNGGLPSMVYNNAIPGLRTNELRFTHLNHILQRHKDAQYVLLGVGTNDAGTNVSVATYKTNMTNMISAIRAAGKTPIVPLIPPRFDNLNQNAVIGGSGGYNTEIPQLGVALGPDLYSNFLNRQDLFPDLLHPNGFGYAMMGELWSQSLGLIP